MKASYTKPLFDVEIFSTNQSVARDCAQHVEFNQTGLEACGWDMGGGNIIFVSGNQTCKIGGENLEMYCYNNPTERNYIMHS